MEYRQFIQLLRSEDHSEKETGVLLQHVLREFPYFQTAHLLLAKSLHDTRHIGYDRQLKIASLYANDRRVLYRLLHPKEARVPTATTNESPFAIAEETASPVTVEAKEMKQAGFTDTIKKETLTEPVAEPVTATSPPAQPKVTPLPSTATHPDTLPDIGTDEYREWYSEEELTGAAFERKAEPESTLDPHEVIRRRLEEITGTGRNDKKRPEPSVERVAEPTVDRQQTPVAETVTAPVEPPATTPAIAEAGITVQPQEHTEGAPMLQDPIDIIAAESAQEQDPVSLTELEYALETSILSSIEQLPVIAPQETESAPNTHQPLNDDGADHTFSSWLQRFRQEGFGRMEEVHADDAAEKPAPEAGTAVVPAGDGPDAGRHNDLIERFIATEPRIVPSKTEFYSPVSQARKSVTEDEDLISETLVRIYLEQGHFLKARSGYQKLSLLHPEKKAYFAALIKGIDEQLNNPNKEDL